jgi:hypothetical protein
VLTLTFAMAVAAGTAACSFVTDAEKRVVGVIAILAASGTWYSALIATRNVIESAERQRAVNTMQALVALEAPDLVNARRIVREAYLPPGDKETDAEAAAFQMLNRLEDIANLVNSGVLDGAICRASISIWVDRYWREIRTRLSPERANSYSELKKLHAKWFP